MKRARGVLAIVAAVALGCAGGRSSLPYYRTAAMTPEWLSGRDAGVASMHHVAAFRALDQRGVLITEQAFAGKATLVQFFFTTCADICPMTTSNLAGALAQLGGETRLQLLSYSVAPERDSIGALQAFARARGITDTRWHLLTAPRADVERLARDSYFVRLGDGTTYGVRSIQHTESVLLVDGRGRLRGVYAGTLGLEIERLREDVTVLLREPDESR